ncbi:D-aminoacyl-tRNA deacylase [Thiolinea disciformis]|uniref:D-aminoacyl-tRNA deacylase n=1 Tax=Thiolinea disciformis TaxID=125614 RepID=UPI00035CB7D9|nr:D-aminoacyl-tRNA deacylase [Thiolinea disciformis]
MIGLIQRVSEASVTIEQQRVAEIQRGILLLLGVEKLDTVPKADRLLERVLNYRIFEDEQGRMNRSLLEIQGNLLVVPQFTLAADTKKGNRPSFTSAADPELGHKLFDYVCTQLQTRFGVLQAGRFGANMQVHLINDGPVTFWLQV